MTRHRASHRTAGSAAFALLGERWTYLIVREIFFGVRRFGQIQRALGIAPNILTSRLNRLVESDVLERRLYHSDPDWFEYHLTQAAREVLPAAMALAQWGEEHLSDDETVRLLRHAGCGELTRPVLVCSQCGEPVTAKDLEPETRQRAQSRGSRRALERS